MNESIHCLGTHQIPKAIHGLTEYERYKVIRPVIGGTELDEYDMPIIRKPSIGKIDWEGLRGINYHNLSISENLSDVLALMFRYDKYLDALWNNPLKRIPLFQRCMAIGTPDFSAYTSMNTNDIRFNVYRSRWLGRTWQNYGCTVLPTVGWAASNTYDICFSGIERETPVIISTIGCKQNLDVFFEGFEEMKRRIHPPIIVVYGDIIDGMTGTFIKFSYESTFAQKHQQLRMREISQIVTIKEGFNGIQRCI